MAKSALDVFSEYLRALVFAFFLAVIIRSFGMEPFKIPSPSMVPSLLVGDHIFVKRFAYGLRLPLTKFWLAEFDDPKRGDVVVFTEPTKEEDDYIKRVVGLPGDKVAMKNGEIYINDQPADYREVRFGPRQIDNSCALQNSQDANFVLPEDLNPFPYYAEHEDYTQRLETLPGETKPHVMQKRRFGVHHDDFEFVVPARHFFVMGDNRDNSADSRFIGPIPRENLKGKAVMIWLSLNSEGGACPYDGIYGWFGPVIDQIFGLIGWQPFGGVEPSPSIRWDRFGRDV